MKQFAFTIEFSCPYSGEVRQRVVEYSARDLDSAREGIVQYMSSNPNMIDGEILTEDAI